MHNPIPCRASGILMHITSLPGPFASGDMHSAFQWIDILHNAKQTYWQILPLTPTDISSGFSPYSSKSAFAGNPLLISPQMLFHEQLLPYNPLFDSDGNLSTPQADFVKAQEIREKFLEQAIARFRTSNHHLIPAYQLFCKEHSHWLHNYALFSSFKTINNNMPWWEWNELPSARSKTMIALIEKVKIIQFFFFHQWTIVRQYARSKNVHIIGDIPLYVSHDSADTWSNINVFQLDSASMPTHVAGVPPDYFSNTGQRWGNPLYNWGAKNITFSWWKSRFHHCEYLYDIARIDHFRGFASYWAIPFHEQTAIHGEWKKGPGISLFTAIKKALPHLRLIAEDLGTLSNEVSDLLSSTGIPGMNVLQFAFNEQGANNAYLPHNHKNHSVVYTGTHDNTTINAWFNAELQDWQREKVSEYCGYSIKPREAHKVLMRMAMSSIAQLCMTPFQDILGLSEDARMNIPGTPNGNWLWRASKDQCTPKNFDDFRALTLLYGRHKDP